MSKSDLPQNWCWATIGDTGEYINGFAFKPQHRSNEGLPIIRIQNLTDDSKPLNYTKLSVPDEYQVRSGDMLVSWSATLDVFIWQRGPALVNQHIFRVIPETKLFDQRLLYYWLKKAIQDLLDTEHLHGSTMKHINRGPFMAHRISLPPRAEQFRIADKLEEVFTDLDAQVEELIAAQEKLAQHRQSLLKAAVDGSLTIQWRAEHAQRGEAIETGAQLLARILNERRSRWEAEQLTKFEKQGKVPPQGWQSKYSEPVSPDTTDLPALPDGWVWANIAQLGNVQLGRQRSPDKLNGLNPTRYIRAANITEHGVDFTDVLEMDFNERERATFELKPGDVLLTEASGSPEHVGRPVIWPKVEGLYCFQNTVIRFITHGISSDYAFHIFLAWQKLGKFQQLSGGVGINHLSAGKFSSMTIPLPPLVEQAEIVNALALAFAATAEQESAIEHSLKQSSAQRKGILKTAFSGKLVPQDPNDEAASVLLERISTERKKREKQPKPRKIKIEKEISAMGTKLKNVLAEAGDWIPAQEAFRRCGVADSAHTDQVEALYAELRELDKSNQLAVESIKDAQGRKLYDQLKFIVTT